MKRETYVQQRLGDKIKLSAGACAEAFAPSNIALIKYWGKRNQTLNPPTASSLSISLGHLGTTTRIELIDKAADEIIFNEQVLKNNSSFVKKIQAYLDLFRLPEQHFLITTQNNFPTAAGLASSASAFAALTKVLATLYQWPCDTQTLSQLARLGSGSACRSLWSGFVRWHKGNLDDGSDCFAEPLAIAWPELYLGVVVVKATPKSISSREAMLHCKKTSPYYDVWPMLAEKDLNACLKVLEARDFEQFGQIVEANAMAMHALMLSARPSIFYTEPETLALMQKVWQWRKAGKLIYFTQDAGPNLKLIFLENDLSFLQQQLPQTQIIRPFK